MNRQKFVALILLLCLLVPALAGAVTFDQREALRGLKGLKVVVENIPPDIERLGLTRKDLQNDVEQKLRKIGIKVYPDFKPPAMTALYVNVHTLIPSGARNIVAYSINVMLFENSYLKRDAGSVGDLKEVRAANWVNAMVGLLPTANISGIRRKVEDQLDKFIADYLAMNR
jgi:hypothetical protein